MKVLDQVQGNNYTLYQGDSCEVLAGIPENSIHYSVTSIPFASLYTYSNSDRDLGNSRNYAEFAEHYSFLWEGMVQNHDARTSCVDSLHESAEYEGEGWSDWSEGLPRRCDQVDAVLRVHLP